MTNKWNLDKEILSKEYDEKKLKYKIDTFYRPSHPDINKPSGWIVSWCLFYQKGVFLQEMAAKFERVFKTQEATIKGKREFSKKDLFEKFYNDKAELFKKRQELIENKELK